MNRWVAEARRAIDSAGECLIVTATARVGLTALKAEVLSWLANGKTDRDIADILGMRPRTVNKHLEQIFEKLGVENRTAAAHVAREMGLIAAE